MGSDDKGSVLSPATRIHPSVDTLLTVLFVWLATSTVFALLTSLTDTGSLAASAPELSEQERYYRAGHLYLWHLLDFLPVIGATDTLNWNEPVARYSGTTGALLLLYKTLVLAPGVVVARRAWTNLKDPAGARDASPAHAQRPATSQTGYCAACSEQRLFVKKPINHVVHLSLSLVTLGHWALFVWLPLALIRTRRKPRCTVCGHKGGRSARRRHAGHGAPTPTNDSPPLGPEPSEPPENCEQG